jgi:hypothetical protein
MLLFFVASQALTIVAYWIASMLLAPERSLIRRALLAYMAIVGVFVIAGVLFALGFPLFARSGVQGMAAGFTIVVGLLVLSLLIAVPVKVYEIGVFRSIGFLVIAGLLSFGLNVGLQMAVLGHEATFDAAPVREWVSQQTPKPVVPRAVRLEELRMRESELARRFQQLTIRHKHLAADDPQAERDYLSDRAAYEKDIQQFREDAAALNAEVE